MTQAAPTSTRWTGTSHREHPQFGSKSRPCHTSADHPTLQSGQHFYLDEGDDCYFFGEYTARRGYNFGETNQLIYNLKKGMERAQMPDFVYKFVSVCPEALTAPKNRRTVSSSTSVNR